MPPITDRPEINKKMWGEDVKGSSTDLQEPTSGEIADGWTPAGIRPYREWDNWLKYFVTKNLAFIEASGIFPWSSTITYDQYGLAREGSQVYYSKTDTNINNQPSTDGGTNWGKAGDIFQPETPVFLVVADENSMVAGTQDGQLQGTEAGNLYTWNDATAKWTARDGNVYSSEPSYVDVEFNDGTIAKIAGATRRYNGAQWEYIGKQINQELTRPNFLAYASSTQIDLQGFGGYHLDGIGWLWFDSTLSYNFTTLVASTWSYLYIDKSTITKPGKITSSNLIDSTTAPTYSATKGGWYNGDDRCIFAVYGLGASSYQRFDIDGDSIIYTDQYIDASAVGITTTWTSVTLTIPTFCDSAYINLGAVYIATTEGVMIRKGGDTAASGLRMLVVDSNNTRDFVNIHKSPVNSSQQVEVSTSNTSATMTLITFGFTIPRGM